MTAGPVQGRKSGARARGRDGLFPRCRTAVLAAAVVAGGLTSAGSASANVEFARMTGRGCSTCHAADRTPARNTVNSVGAGFNGCHLDQYCIRQWRDSLPPEAPVGGGRRFVNGVLVDAYPPPPPPPRYPPNY